jgi:hypothetical protein
MSIANGLLELQFLYETFFLCQQLKHTSSDRANLWDYVLQI